MKKLLPIILLCLFIQRTKAQQRSLGANEAAFIRHLIDSKFYDESIAEAEGLLQKPYTMEAKDSLYYYMGLSYYYKKEGDAAGRYLMNVKSSNLDLYSRARLL